MIETDCQRPMLVIPNKPERVTVLPNLDCSDRKKYEEVISYLCDSSATSLNVNSRNITDGISATRSQPQSFPPPGFGGSDNNVWHFANDVSISVRAVISVGFTLQLFLPYFTRR